MNDSTAVLWVSVVPSIMSGRSSIGGVAGLGIALGFLSGHWEARVAAAGTFELSGSAGGFVSGIGTLYDVAVLYRPRRFRHKAGPFFGGAVGYANGPSSPAGSLLGGADLSVTRRVVLHLELKFTEAFTGPYVADVENPVVRNGLRQVLFAVGVGFTGPFY
jgi:hypothetical protein